MRKKLLSVFLALCMILSLVPTAFAADEPAGEQPAEITPDENGEQVAPVVKVGGDGYSDLAAAIADAPVGGTVTLQQNVVLTTTVVVNKELTLELNGCKISNTAGIWDVSGEAVTAKKWSLISVQGSGADLTINGSGTLQAMQNDCYAVDVKEGASCTINGGKYVGNVHAVYVHTGSLTVTDGEFSIQQTYPNDPGKPYEFTLNCYDPSREARTATISVSGGKFYKFDPGKNYAEGENTSFLAEGCASEADGEYYTVKKAAYSITIAEDIANGTVTADKETAAAGDTVKLTVTPAGGYKLDTLTVTGPNGTVAASGNKFTMPAGDVTVTAAFKKSTPSVPYTPPAPTTTTTTEKNEDGSTTTTVTNTATGTVTETTKNTDGSFTVVETKKDGTVTTTNEAADGSTTTEVVNPNGSSTLDVKQADGTTATVTTNADGSTQTEVSVSDKAAADAQESGETVALPIPPVAATATTEDAPAVAVTIPDTEEAVKVEIPASDTTPGTVAVIVHADGTEEIVKTSIVTENGVALPLEESATVKIVDNSRDFEDTEGHWAEDAICFTTAREMFHGTSETTFAPDDTLTRGMLAVVLHNFENNPAAALDETFDDVDEDQWYTDGIQWAAANGIVTGYGNGMFGANDEITREQLVTMLYRYAVFAGFDTTAAADLSQFADGDEISGYAAEAMSWAVETGLIVGVGNGNLAPRGSATRAQVATILMRYVENMSK